MYIHKEGYAPILVVLLLLLGIDASIYLFLKIPVLPEVLYIASVLFFFFVVYFFRIPKRTFISGEDKVIAPADGKVVVIEKVYEPEFFNEERIQVSIFMSPLNVHVNRYPIDGIIKYFKYHPGKYLVAWHPKSSTLNERTTCVLENKKKNKSLLVRQIAGTVARRIIYYCEEGKEIKQNEELGFIRFGSRVDLFLPLDSNIKVKIDDIVQNGITEISDF